MIIEITDKSWLGHADNLRDIVQWLADTRPTWPTKASVSNPANQSWDLNTDYAKAMQYARDGWDEGVRKLEALQSNDPTYLKPVKAYGVMGDHADIGRYVTGDPFNMVRRVKERVVKPAVTLVVNVVASAGVSANEMANYGSAMAVLVDRLESRGIRVELYGAITIDGLKRKFTFTWSIKQADQPLDMAAIAFSLAHPAMFRRLLFAVIERTERDMVHGGYGYPGTTEAGFSLVPDRTALYIQGVGQQFTKCTTMAAALDLAMKQINEASVKAGGERLAELEEEYV